MNAPTKRTLTEKVREAGSSSDSFSRSSSWGTPEDLVLRLRSTAARGRKSVLEGYKTTPTISKAQSTGTLIFNSMKDTLADVYSHNHPLSGVANSDRMLRKRSHSVMEREEDGSNPKDCVIRSQNDEFKGSHLPFGVDSISSRPVKPLRVSRRLSSHFLSVSSGFPETKSSANYNVETPMEEEDWSQEKSFQSLEPSFDPMIL